MSQSPLAVSWEDVASAAERLVNVALRTPVYSSPRIDDVIGASIYFKCECQQTTGAFKLRGAYNALSQLSEDEKRRGVITFSSGNHGQGIARCGNMLGVKATVVMPANAPALKIAATRKLGAEVILYNPDTEVREEIARKIQAERGVTLIPPFDHAHVIAGQGTAAVELFQETGPLDYLFVPVGGGGLISGCAIAAHELAPTCKVIGVEPQAGDDATRSFRTGVLQVSDHPDTIADGARTRSLGSLTFPIIKKLVSDFVTVSDPELLAAMRVLAAEFDVVVEPTGALAAAAVLSKFHDVQSGRIRVPRVGVIVSGGNVDPTFYAEVLHVPA